MLAIRYRNKTVRTVLANKNCNSYTKYVYSMIDNDLFRRAPNVSMKTRIGMVQSGIRCDFMKRRRARFRSHIAHDGMPR